MFGVVVHSKLAETGNTQTQYLDTLLAYRWVSSCIPPVINGVFMCS